MMKKVYELAESLHSKKCTWNHIDGCSWGYEEDFSNSEKELWESGTHARYLESAKQLIKDTELHVETILKVIDHL